MPDGGFWEPWQPKIGNRVRVAVSPECEFMCPQGHSWHWPAMQGQIGYISAIVTEGGLSCICDMGDMPYRWAGDMPFTRGHYYVVLGESLRLGGWYAAIELIPVMSEPDA